jgi:putative transcriptional regulator
MGIVVNQHAERGLERSASSRHRAHRRAAAGLKVMWGPVESSRGFVCIRPTTYTRPMMIDESFALTATVERAQGHRRREGPKQKVFALGYAGWPPGQLDARSEERLADRTPDESIVFESTTPRNGRALRKVGVDRATLLRRSPRLEIRSWCDGRMWGR